MRRVLLITALVLPLMGYVDCEPGLYTVELKPEGEQVSRTLTYRGPPSRAGDLEGDERLATMYAQDLSTAKRLAFHGRFTAVMPPDIGGGGRLLHLESAMGTASAYLERFGGTDDQVEPLSRVRQLGDRCLGLLIRWMDHELAVRPEQPAVHRFLDGQLRRDLQNLMLIAYGSRALSGAEPSGRFGAKRMALYLLERGYLSVQRVPAVLGAIRDAWAGDASALLAELRRLLAWGAGGPYQGDAFGFLSTRERAAGALADWLRTTPEYARLSDRYEAAQLEASEGLSLRPLKVLDPLAVVTFEALQFEPMSLYPSTLAQLDLTLHAPVEPYRHNGAWDGKAGVVRWARVELRDEPAVPFLAFASWSVPARPYQIAHFGKVILEGERLADYAMWHAGLSRAHRGEWDDMLAGLGPWTLDAIERFEFSGRPRHSAGAPHEIKQLFR